MRNVMSDSKPEYMLAIVGFALFWAWVDNSFFLPMVFESASHGDFAADLQHIHAWVIAVSVLPGIVLVGMKMRSGRCTEYALFGTFTLVAGGLVSGAGTVLLIVYALSNSTILFVFAVLLCGCGMGLIVVLWGLVFASFGLRWASICAAGGIALSLIINFGVKGFIPLVATALVCLFPLFSAMCLKLAGSFHALRRSKEASESLLSWGNMRKKLVNVFGRVPVRLLCMLVMITFMFEIMQAVLVSPSSNPALMTNANLASRGAVGAVVFVGILVFRWATSKTLKFGFFFMAAGFLFEPFVSSTLFSNVVFVAGYTICDIMVWTLLGAFGKTWPNDSLYYVVAFWVLKKLGSLAGIVFGEAMGALSSFDTSAILTVLAYGVFALAVMILDRGGFKIWEIIQDSDEAFDGALVKVDALSQNHGLTLREKEVFSYLAEGRSIPWIAPHLGIAEGTVRVHARHVYEKLGVHSKQELIDMVNEPLKGE